MVTDTGDNATTSILPLVTVAVPTFNRVEFLREAIESALTQNYPNIEVFISDNASTDGTGVFLGGLNDPRIRIVRQPTNVGLTGNWNASLAGVRGEYYIMLNDDDTLVPTAISDLMRPMLSAAASGALPAEKIAFCYGYCEISFAAKNTKSFSKSAPTSEPSEVFREKYMRFERVSYPSATLLRVADARMVGGYCEANGGPIDIDIVFRVSALRPLVACSQTKVTNYRFYPANFTSSLTTNQVTAHALGLAKLAAKIAQQSGDRAIIGSSRRAGEWHTAHVCAHYTFLELVSGSKRLSVAFARVASLRWGFIGLIGFTKMTKLILKLLLWRVFGWRGDAERSVTAG